MPRLTLAALEARLGTKIPKTKKCITEYTYQGQIFNSLEAILAHTQPQIDRFKALVIQDPDVPDFPPVLEAQLPSGDPTTGTAREAIESFLDKGLEIGGFHPELEQRVKEAIIEHDVTKENYHLTKASGVINRLMNEARCYTISRNLNADFRVYPIQRTHDLLAQQPTTQFLALAKIVLATGLRISSLTALECTELPLSNGQLAIPSTKLNNQTKGFLGHGNFEEQLEIVEHPLIPVEEIQSLWTTFKLWELPNRCETFAKNRREWKSSYFYKMVGTPNELRHLHKQALVYYGKMEVPSYQKSVNSTLYYLNWKAI